MIDVHFTVSDKTGVKHVDYYGPQFSFMSADPPDLPAGIAPTQYTLYTKHFSESTWAQQPTAITPSTILTVPNWDQWTHMAIACTFADGTSQKPESCIAFAPVGAHPSALALPDNGTLSYYGERMLMEFPEVMAAKYNDNSNLGLLAHSIGSAFDGADQMMHILSLLKQYRAVQDTPDMAYTYTSILFTGSPQATIGSTTYTLNDASDIFPLLPNGLMPNTNLNTSGMSYIVGDLSPTMVVDKWATYYDLEANPEDTIIYYSATNAAITMYSSVTYDQIGTFAIYGNGSDLLAGNTIVGVDVTPEYLYVAYVSGTTFNIAIVSKSIQMGANALEAKAVLTSTELPSGTILGIKVYTNEVIVQTTSGYYGYRKMFNYYYIDSANESIFYTFEPFDSVSVTTPAGSIQQLAYQAYANIWTDVDDMMQNFNQYRSVGERVGPFYFSSIYELSHPINSTLQAMKSYLYYVISKPPYNTDPNTSVVFDSIDKHPYFQNMLNGLTSDTLNELIASNRTTWGTAQYGNVAKALPDSFANTFAPLYDNAPTQYEINGISYQTPSGGSFIYTDSVQMYNAPTGKDTFITSTPLPPFVVQANFEPIFDPSGNTIFLRSAGALQRVIAATNINSDTQTQLSMASTAVATLTITYENTFGSIQTETYTLTNGTCTLDYAIAPEGSVTIDAQDANGNSIDVYWAPSGHNFAYYNPINSSITSYESKQFNVAITQGV